jgi:hypothetical protein
MSALLRRAEEHGVIEIRSPVRVELATTLVIRDDAGPPPGS